MTGFYSLCKGFAQRAVGRAGSIKSGVRTCAEGRTLSVMVKGFRRGNDEVFEVYLGEGFADNRYIGFADRKGYLLCSVSKKDVEKIDSINRDGLPSLEQVWD